jgi:hypothetical protein
MKYDIPEDILHATQCMKGFSCLSQGWKPCGIVKGIIENKIIALEVDLENYSYCEYRVPFGGGMFCTCPTGVEVLKRFLLTTVKTEP